MRRVVRCLACSSCARVAGCGFVARARLWCTELGRWVDADDGRAFGERGGARGGRRAMQRRGRPTQARDPRGGVVAMPTVTIWHATWCAPAKGRSSTSCRACARRASSPPSRTWACTRARPGTGTWTTCQPSRWTTEATSSCAAVATPRRRRSSASWGFAGRGRPGWRPHPRVRDVTTIKAP